jgi:hypothetical protein
MTQPSNKPRHIWTKQELATLRELYPTTRTADIAALLGIDLELVYRRAALLRIRKNPEFFARDKSGRIFKGGKLGQTTQFAPGQKPWNTGRKGWQAGGRSAETQFHTGALPPTTMPVGAYRVITTKGGKQFLERKVRQVPGASHKRWTPVSRLVWEAEHGPVPHGSIVVFKPGQRTLVLEEITLDRLELITRAQHARRNHPNTRSPELGRLYQLKGQITRQVNRLQKERATT